MRGGQRKSIVATLIFSPWQLSVALGLALYLFLSVMLRRIDSGVNALNRMFELLSGNALYIVSPLLIISFLSAFRSWRMGRLFRSQTSIETIKKLSWRQFEYLVAEAYHQKSITQINPLASNIGIENDR